MMASNHGARSGTHISEAGNLRMLTINFDGIQGSLRSFIDWIVLNDVDVIAMQESKLRAAETQSVINAFAEKGYTAFLSKAKLDRTKKPEAGMLVASRRPAIPLKPPTRMIQSHLAQFVQIHRNDGPPLCLLNAHVKCADSTAQQELFLHQCFEHCATFGMDIVALGDWNCQPWEAPITGLIAAQIVVLPETVQEATVPTRKGGRRHIDYALVTPAVRVRGRQMVEFDSDHHGICYDLPDTGMVGCFQLAPKMDHDASLSVTFGEWEAAFASKRARAHWLLETKQSTESFNLLQLAAEQVLAKRTPSNAKAASCADRVHTVVKTATAKARGEGQDSVQLARLKRLYRRRREINHQPDDDKLEKAYHRNRKQLMHLFGPEALPLADRADTDSLDDDLRKIQALIDDCSRDLGDDRITAWRTRMQLKDKHIADWVKRDLTVPLSARARTTLHPQQCVEEEAAKLRKLWTPRGD